MNVIPWRRRSAIPTVRSDYEGFFDSLFDPFARSQLATHLPEVFRGQGLPPVNLAEDEKSFRATVELPGLDEKDIELSILGNQLIISGERKWEEKEKDKEYYRVESQFGQFRRAIGLPEGLQTDPDSIRATYKKGMLEVEIPKVEPKPVSKIEIKG